MRVSFDQKTGAVVHTMRAAEHRGLKITRDMTTGKPKTCSGYFIVFNSESESFGTDMTGRDIREVIDPNACDDCLAGNPDIRCLTQHQSGNVLGRTASGTFRIRKDDYGVFGEVDLPNTTIASDLAELIERGDIDGCSFGFWIGNSNDALDYIESDNKVVQVVRKIERISEMSIVTFPAYPATNVSLREMPFYDKLQKHFRAAPKPLDAPQFQTRSLSLRLELHKQKSKLWNI